MINLLDFMGFGSDELSQIKRDYDERTKARQQYALAIKRERIAQAKMPQATLLDFLKD
jgi:hypothetical protein